MMHDGGFLGELSHFTLSFGHGVFGLLLLFLVIVPLAALIRLLFRIKD